METVLGKHIEKERDALTKTLWHLSNQVFKCANDAQMSGLQETKSLKYHHVSWTITPVEKHVGRGRPKKGATPVIQGYQIQGIIEQDDNKVELIKRRKGRFILATNELDCAKLAEQDFLAEYKKQYKTEQSFAFIKGNAFEVSSIFLKKPSRIQALMVVMTLCLMVYSFAQYHLRKALVEAEESIPDQLKKPTQKPSMSWVFRLFQGIQLWLIPTTEGINELVVNLSALTRRIIGYFGPVAESIYASSG